MADTRTRPRMTRAKAEQDSLSTIPRRRSGSLISAPQMNKGTSSEMACTTTGQGNDHTKAVWIGLVNVIPFRGTSPLSKGAQGAFVNALVTARDRAEYIRRVKSALSSLNLKATQFEDVGTFRDRSDTSAVSQEFYKLAREAEATSAVVFSSFHNYFQED